MNQVELAREIVSIYQKHGWQLRRMLLRPETRAAFDEQKDQILEGVSTQEATVDALWFSRPSHGKREAWELRLLAETQYALFEAFEASQPEDLRTAAQLGMEARMIELHGSGA